MSGNNETQDLSVCEGWVRKQPNHNVRNESYRNDGQEGQQLAKRCRYFNDRDVSGEPVVRGQKQPQEILNNNNNNNNNSSSNSSYFNPLPNFGSSSHLAIPQAVNANNNISNNEPWQQFSPTL